MTISKDQTKSGYYLMRCIAMDIAIKLITRNVMVFWEEMVKDDYDIKDLY